MCNDHALQINREIFDSVVIVRREFDCSDVWEQLGFDLIYLLNDAKEVVADFHKLVFVLNAVCENL